MYLSMCFVVNPVDSFISMFMIHALSHVYIYMAHQEKGLYMHQERYNTMYLDK